MVLMMIRRNDVVHERHHDGDDGNDNGDEENDNSEIPWPFWLVRCCVRAWHLVEFICTAIMASRLMKQPAATNVKAAIFKKPAAKEAAKEASVIKGATFKKPAAKGAVTKRETFKKQAAKEASVSKGTTFKKPAAKGAATKRQTFKRPAASGVPEDPQPESDSEDHDYEGDYVLDLVNPDLQVANFWCIHGGMDPFEVDFSKLRLPHTRPSPHHRAQFRLQIRPLEEDDGFCDGVVTSARFTNWVSPVAFAAIRALTGSLALA